MATVRPPAVAGSFYPAEPRRLRAMVQDFLQEAAGAPGARLTQAMLHRNPGARAAPDAGPTSPAAPDFGPEALVASEADPGAPLASDPSPAALIASDGEVGSPLAPRAGPKTPVAPHAGPNATEAPRAGPKALIAPHAGYVYSGPIAARAFAALGAAAARIRRVVVVGPAHFVPIRGIAAPTVAAFRTPLGEVPLDRPALEAIGELSQVSRADPPHADEHALEVELPFLQVLLGEFALVPLVVGEAAPAAVAEVLARLWDGPETLIVVSSDLSHYQSYAEAQRLDAATAARIEALEETGLGPYDACGWLPIAGLLLEARRRGLSPVRLDLRNSGDTAGPRDRVVGYGAWAFCEPD